MIKEINKGENGFRITTDKGEIFLDYYHEVGISLDYYWLLECKNNQEMTMLLRSWYNKQTHNNA